MKRKVPAWLAVVLGVLLVGYVVNDQMNAAEDRAMAVCVAKWSLVDEPAQVSECMDKAESRWPFG